MKRKDRTTIWVSDSMWFRLNTQKHKGDSMESVLDKFIPKVKVKFIKRGKKK